MACNITKMPMQYTQIFFSDVKTDIFSIEKIDVFKLLAQNIDFGYTLEFDSNKYPQSMLWIKIIKIVYRYTPQF